jgi:hypothetical protein
MKLLRLQEQNGSGHLFIVSLPDWGEIPFKLPSVRRAQQYAAAMLLTETEADKVMFYETIFRECVPDEELAFGSPDMPAGIIQSIGDLVLFLSGVSEHTLEYTQELFNTFRDETMRPVNYMKRVICSVFSAYTFENLEDLNYQQLVELFINSEKMMMEAGLIEEPFTFETPKKGVRMPTGPAGPMGVPAAPRQPSGPPGVTADGPIDIEALVEDGKRMEKELDTMPPSSAMNLKESPAYKARAEMMAREKKVRRQLQEDAVAKHRRRQGG